MNIIFIAVKINFVCFYTEWKWSLPTILFVCYTTVAPYRHYERPENSLFIMIICIIPVIFPVPHMSPISYTQFFCDSSSHFIPDVLHYGHKTLRHHIYFDLRRYAAPQDSRIYEPDAATRFQRMNGTWCLSCISTKLAIKKSKLRTNFFYILFNYFSNANLKK